MNPALSLFTLMLLGLVAIFSIIVILYLGLLLVGAPLRYFWNTIKGLLGMGTRYHGW